MFVTAHTMPERTIFPMVDICSSNIKVLLVSTSPIAFDFQVHLGCGDTKNMDLAEPKQIKLTHTHELAWNFLKLLHLEFPVVHVNIDTKIDFFLVTFRIDSLVLDKLGQGGLALCLFWFWWSVHELCCGVLSYDVDDSVPVELG